MNEDINKKDYWQNSKANKDNQVKYLSHNRALRLRLLTTLSNLNATPFKDAIVDMCRTAALARNPLPYIMSGFSAPLKSIILINVDF